MFDRFSRLQTVPPDSSDYSPATVDAILRAARESNATDVHLTPTADALRMQWRIDGVLHDITTFPLEDRSRIVSRLKVLAGLLTYRTDVPQEGRIGEGEETRVSTLPTLYGERAVIRLFAEAGRFEWLEQLGLPDGVESRTRERLERTSGVIVFSGPAGSGKTTTIYSCLREIAAATNGSRSLVSVEDPIEVVLPEVAQSQVNDSAGFDLTAALRAMMRQDPEVIMVGEIRDADTAEAVFQAALTGHLVLTTFHAGSATGAVSRLLDMGLEPYLLRSAVQGVISQRLMRRLCACSEMRPLEANTVLGESLEQAGMAVGCESCGGTGYSGRVLVAEMLCPDDSETGRAILSRTDTAELQKIAIDGGMVSQRSCAMQLVRDGVTSVDEVFRVFGSQK